MTASAKEVIAAAQVEFLHGVPVSVTDAGATAILAALDAAGLVVVPREPTDLMGLGLPSDYRPGNYSASYIYRAMIAAQEKQG